MGRFIITEEERKRIRGLYEMVGDKLSPQSLQSPKAQNIKKQSLFLNQYYTMNLSSATTGSWTDKDFNDTLKKFMEEKGIPVWICKKGDGYCADGDEGEVTTKEMYKLRQSMNLQGEDKSATFLAKETLAGFCFNEVEILAETSSIEFNKDLSSCWS